jgi:hypothetical protein
MGMVHNVQSMTSLANALGLDSKNVWPVVFLAAK